MPGNTKQETVVGGFVRGEIYVGKGESDVVEAIRCLSFARLYYPEEYKRFVSYYLPKHGAAEWSLNNPSFCNALLEFRTHFVQLLNQNPSIEHQYNKLSPKELVENLPNQLQHHADRTKESRREFAQKLTKSYIQQLGLTLKPDEENHLVDMITSEVATITTSGATPQELISSLSNKLNKVISTQYGATISEGGSLEMISRALHELPKGPQQVLVSAEATTQAVIGASTPDKSVVLSLIESVVMRPSENTQTYLSRVDRIARAATAARSVLPEKFTKHPGDLLELFTKTGLQKTLAPLASLLSIEAQDALVKTLVATSWKSAIEVVDATMKRAGEMLTPEFEAFIQRGNQTVGQGGARAGVGAAENAILGLMAPLFRGSLDSELVTMLELQAHGSRLPKDGRPLTPPPPTESLVALVFASYYVTHPAPYPFVEKNSRGVHETPWFIDFAGDELVGRLAQKVAQNEVARGFFSRLGGLISRMLGGQAGARVATGAAAAAGAGVAAAGGPVGWVAAVVGFVVGSFIGPVIRGVVGFAGKLSRLEIGNIGIVQQQVRGAVEELLRSITGGSGAAPREFYEKDWFLPLVAVGLAVILPLLVLLAPAAILSGIAVGRSTPVATGGPYDPVEDMVVVTPDRAQVGALSCPVENQPISQGPFTRGESHENVCAYDFAASKGTLVTTTHYGCVSAMVSGIPVDTPGEGYGNYIKLIGKNPDDSPFYTIYGHMYDINPDLKLGGCYPMGTPVGKVDATGNTYSYDKNNEKVFGGATHLHYEYNDNAGGCVELPVECR